MSKKRVRFIVAKIREMDVPAWNEWVSTRPHVVQDLCRRFPPDRLYLLKSSGHRVTIYSYSEHGTLTVVVSGQYNLLTFNRQVFGIDPVDLSECDMPAQDDCLGTVFTEQDDVDGYIDLLRKIEK